MGTTPILDAACAAYHPQAEHLTCYVQLFHALHIGIEDAFGGDGETEWTEDCARETLRQLCQVFRDAGLPARTTPFQHVFALFLHVLWDQLNPTADETVVALFLRASEARKHIAVFKQYLEALSAKTLPVNGVAIESGGD